MSDQDRTQVSSAAAVQHGYSGGYDGRVVQGLSQRSVIREGAFFLPYLRSGMDVLDCGCGPGTMTVQVAAVVAPGAVVGIDLESSQFSVGRARAQARSLGNVRFEQASIYALPFPDESFDLVYAHAVLYHLDRPEAALGEIHRVLRPGGLIAVRDSDTRGDIYAPADPHLDRAWELAARVMHDHGGNPGFGAQQRAILREAGFVDIVATASYDAYGTPALMQGFSAFWAAFLSEHHAERIVRHGWATRDELAELAGVLTGWGLHPDAFAARARCEAIGRKPA
ncbi:MAG: class I SAM-dependent methyltransferase [Thermomicrobiales bacterium]